MRQGKRAHTSLAYRELSITPGMVTVEQWNTVGGDVFLQSIPMNHWGHGRRWFSVRTFSLSSLPIHHFSLFVFLCVFSSPVLLLPVPVPVPVCLCFLNLLFLIFIQLVLCFARFHFPLFPPRFFFHRQRLIPAALLLFHLLLSPDYTLCLSVSLPLISCGQRT